MHDYNRHHPKTSFDKLAIALCWFGAFILIALHVTLVSPTQTIYGEAGLVTKVVKLVSSRGFAASMVMLMLYLAYYGSQLRKHHDRGSGVLFFGIVVAVGANALLIWSLYAPSGSALDSLR